MGQGQYLTVNKYELFKYFILGISVPNFNNLNQKITTSNLYMVAHLEYIKLGKKRKYTHKYNTSTLSVAALFN